MVTCERRMKDNRRLLSQVFVFCFALCLVNGFSYYGNYYSSSQYGGYPSKSGYRTYRNTDLSRRGFWCSYVVMRNASCTVSYLDRVIEKFQYDCTKYNNKRKYCSGYRSQFVTRYKTEYKLKPTTITRCCPGFNGPLCDQECFNCTTIKNLLQELEALKRDQRTLAQVQVQRGKSYKSVVDFPSAEPKGQKGSQGDLGPPGKPGKPGAVGPQGPRGAVGPRGFKGTKGDPGPIGSPGKAGPKGEKGEAGVAGPPGPPGYTIQISPDADFRELKRDGRDIVVGPKGIKGEEGPHGLKGEKGDPGDYITGRRGPRGPPGISIKGEPGGKGDMGPPGLPGQVIHSYKGQRPIPGLPGIPGAQGDKGEKGEAGQRGPKGSAGVADDMITDLRNEIGALKKIVEGILKNCRCASTESNLHQDLFVIN